MHYALAYRIGFHPWENAAGEDAFVDRFAELLDREEQGRQPPYGPALDLGTGSGSYGAVAADLQPVRDSGVAHHATVRSGLLPEGGVRRRVPVVGGRA
jgi:hypothetical protein